MEFDFYNQAPFLFILDWSTFITSSSLLLKDRYIHYYSNK